MIFYKKKNYDLWIRNIIVLGWFF